MSTVPSIELAPEKTADTRAILSRLRDNIRTTENPSERQQSIRSTLQSLTRTQLEILDGALKKEATAPTISISSDEINAMRAGVDQELHARLQQLGQSIETWYKPQTWSPQTKQQMEAVGWGVGIGAAAVGLALLWRATKKKVSEKVKATSEKAGRLWGKVKWFIGGTVAVGLGYIGVRSFQEFRKLSSLTNELSKTKKEIERLAGKSTEYMTATEKKILEAAELKAQQLELAIQNVRGEAAAAGAKVTKAIDEQKSGVQNIVKNPEVRDAVEQVKESAEESMIARLILEFTDTTEWKIDPAAKRNQLVGLVSNNHEKNMGAIEDDPESVLQLPSDTKDEESRLKSVEVLIQYCDSQRPKMIQRIMAEKSMTAEAADNDLRNMTLLTYLGHTMRDAIPFAENISHLEKGPKDIEGFIKGIQSFDQSKALMASESAKKVILTIVHNIGSETIGITEEEMKAINMSDLLIAALSLSGSTLANAKIDLEKVQNPNPTQKALLAIVRKICDKDNNTYRVILPFFHGVFPDMKGSGDTSPESQEQRVQRYLIDRMTAQEAIRFYIYHRMIAGGNALALPLIQLDVIRFIARHDDGYFPGSKKTEVMAEMTKSVALNGGNKIIEEWRKMNIDFDIELTEEEENMLSKFGLMLASIPFTGTREGLMAFLGLTNVAGGSRVTDALGKACEAQPWLFNTVRGWITLYVAANGVTGSVVVIGKRTRIGALACEGLNNPERFAKLLDNIQKGNTPSSLPGMANKVVRKILSPLVFTTKELDKAKVLYRAIYNEGIKKLTNTAQGDQATILFKKCIQNPRIVSHWTALADYLEKIGTTSEDIRKAAQKARLLAMPQAARIRGALFALRIPMEWTINPFKIGHNIATVAIDRGVAKGIETARLLGLPKLMSALKTNKNLAALLTKIGMTPQQFLLALKSAQKLKLAGKAIPFAFPGLMYYIYTFIEEPEWQEELSHETDPLKRQVIENQMFSARMNFQLETVGAMALFSPAGIALFLGNPIRQSINESIVYGTKYMLQTRSELMEKSPGEILSEIQQSRPGSMASVGQRIAATVTLEPRNFNAANTSLRREAYAAYFERDVILPPVPDAFLTTEEQKDPHERERRIDILEKDQRKYFVTSAVSYIGRSTGNEFASTDPALLQKAETYAFLCWKDWVASRLGKESVFVGKEQNDQETMVDQALKQEKEEGLALIEQAKSDPEKRTQVLAYVLLSGIKHDLSSCEARILQRGYWDWAELARMRMTNETELQQIARAGYATLIEKHMTDLAAGSEPWTKERLASSMKKLINILEQDPNTMAMAGLRGTYRKELATRGEDKELLSPLHLLGQNTPDSPSPEAESRLAA